MKYFIPVVLVLCFLCLSGCSKKQNESSSTSFSSYSYTSTTSVVGIQSSSGLQSAEDVGNSSALFKPDINVTLKNTTGKIFVETYVRPNGTTNPWRKIVTYWREDEFLLSFPAPEIEMIQRWDIRMFDEEYTEYIWYGMDMKASSKIDLAIANNQPTFVYK